MAAPSKFEQTYILKRNYVKKKNKELFDEIGNVLQAVAIHFEGKEEQFDWQNVDWDTRNNNYYIQFYYKPLEELDELFLFIDFPTDILVNNNFTDALDYLTEREEQRITNEHDLVQKVMAQLQPEEEEDDLAQPPSETIH